MWVRFPPGTPIDSIGTPERELRYLVRRRPNFFCTSGVLLSGDNREFTGIKVEIGSEEAIG